MQHADDIRTVATSNDSLEKQVAVVRKFASENFLTQNVQKCEVVMFGTARGGVAPVCKVEGCVLPISDAGKCLRLW